MYRSLQGARATKVLTFRFARYLPKARVVPAFERALLKRVAAERADEAKRLCSDLVPDGGLLADDEIYVTYRDDGATVEAALRRRRGGALETTPLFTRSDAELWSAFQGCYFDDKTAAPQTRVELTRRLPALLDSRAAAPADGAARADGAAAAADAARPPEPPPPGEEDAAWVTAAGGAAAAAAVALAVAVVRRRRGRSREDEESPRARL